MKWIMSLGIEVILMDVTSMDKLYLVRSIRKMNDGRQSKHSNFLAIGLLV